MLTETKQTPHETLHLAKHGPTALLGSRLEGPRPNKLASYLKHALKMLAQAISLFAALPFALLTGFGRFSSVFQALGHLVALVPGLPGDYIRVAYYVMTLDHCSFHSRVSFGSFFAQPSISVGRGVYIGAYCIIGTCKIGERTQIASHVQVLGGRYQHRRDDSGRILGAGNRDFKQVIIGADCWIGAAAIVMEDIGSNTTIGAGAVVTRPIPPGVVAVGNPARPLGSFD